MSGYSLPRDLESDIVGLLYKQAADLNWTNLPDAERTKMYRRWTENPDIGGRLELFIGRPESVRTWIKDGPMKEYTRATYGVGKFASCISRPSTSIDTLVAKALGNTWIPDPETLQIKPLSVHIRHMKDEDREQCFAWGPVRDFKHLVWAAISAQANGDPLPWVICVIDSFVRPVTSKQKSFHERIGHRLDLTIKHITDG